MTYAILLLFVAGVAAVSAFCGGSCCEDGHVVQAVLPRLRALIGRLRAVVPALRPPVSPVACATLSGDRRLTAVPLLASSLPLLI